MIASLGISFFILSTLTFSDALKGMTSIVFSEGMLLKHLFIYISFACFHGYRTPTTKSPSRIMPFVSHSEILHKFWPPPKKIPRVSTNRQEPFLKICRSISVSGDFRMFAFLSFGWPLIQSMILSAQCSDEFHLDKDILFHHATATTTIEFLGFSHPHPNPTAPLGDSILSISLLECFCGRVLCLFNACKRHSLKSFFMSYLT